MEQLIDRLNNPREYSVALRIAKEMEEAGDIPAPPGPWPTPPLRPRSQIEPDVEDWRQQRIQMFRSY
jgi:hypothetical protein